MNSLATMELQRYLSVPPSDFRGNIQNQAMVAHAALEALRNSGDERFLFLRAAMELMKDPYKNEELLFHCITGVRHVILYTWTCFTARFRDCVRDFFMTKGHTNMPRTIRIACYSTSASFWKRQWNEPADTIAPFHEPVRQEEVILIECMAHHQRQVATKKDLFQHLENDLLLIEGASVGMGCTYLCVLVGELAGKSAIQYNLPLEFHMKAHASFEQDGWLDESLRLSMGALSLVVSQISYNPTVVDEEFAWPVVQLAIDVISWEFGKEAWDVGIPHSRSKTLLRLPVTWKEYLIRPDFVGAVFHVHELVARRGHSNLAHLIRQLLLLLASLGGPLLSDETQRTAFAAYLTEGTLTLLSSCESTEESSKLLDVLLMVSRIIANFKLATLVQLPTFVPLLNGITVIGTSLLQYDIQECDAVKGDIEQMEHHSWRKEALSFLLEGVVLLCGDHWLLYSGSEETRKNDRASLSKALAPLYKGFVMCRVQLAKLEEYYLTVNAAELDEDKEEISATDWQEEMSSEAIIGRLNLGESISCLFSMYDLLQPQLSAMWDAKDQIEISPENAALLEEVRVLTLCIGHLLTDENSGETSVIPESIVMACRAGSNETDGITNSVQSILSMAERQATKIAHYPSDPRFSPLLASAILWFLNRWAPAYIHPITYGSTGDDSPSMILSIWAKGQSSSQQTVTFCTTLSLHYQCYWPHERQLQQSTATLLLSLANRGEDIRFLMVSSPSFHQMVNLHCLTATICHNTPTSDLHSAIQANDVIVPFTMAHGYQRLSYEDRSRILTAILVSSSDQNSYASVNLLNKSLEAVQTAFSWLIQAINSKNVSPESMIAKHMSSLCVEMYGGIARASEMAEPDRIPLFITPSLPHLSGLMAVYAEDLVICEGLLRLFRDYSEHFVAMLTTDQSVALFTASADLLKSYSVKHCSARVVKRPALPSADLDSDEEQSYSDILCIIQFLIHLGTKDFIDICTTSTHGGVDSSQVTDVIFFGLQQILPLITQGLLLYPELCTQYFSLVSFMMDTYPDKVCILPYELFDALFESLLFGMSHVDSFVSKSSLQGIGAIVREHIKSGALAHHFASHSDIFDKCSGRLLRNVIFQSMIWDRLEPAGLTLLPLIAVDVHRFAAVVNGLTNQAPLEHQVRLHAAFQSLIQPAVLSKVSSGGYEGRMNRMRFKKDFEVFVKEVHSFLLLK